MATLAAALGLSLFTVSPDSAALAGQHLNCNAYAGAAVAQNQQNIAQNCGFTGGRWSSDFNGHFNWCKGANMAALTGEDRARQAMLQQCAAKPAQDQQACQAYAQEAVAQQKGNKSRSCGLKGAGWSENYATHFNWCLKANQGARNAAQNARNQQLAGCVSVQQAQQAAAEKALKDACAKYAATAVAQANENVQRKCGHTGGRWGAQFEPHFNWCLKVRVNARNAETAARAGALNERCGKRVCRSETVPTTKPPYFHETKRVCRYVPN